MHLIRGVHTELEWSEIACPCVRVLEKQVRMNRNTWWHPRTMMHFEILWNIALPSMVAGRITILFDTSLTWRAVILVCSSMSLDPVEVKFKMQWSKLVMVRSDVAFDEGSEDAVKYSFDRLERIRPLDCSALLDGLVATGTFDGVVTVGEGVWTDCLCLKENLNFEVEEARKSESDFSMTLRC